MPQYPPGGQFKRVSTSITPNVPGDALDATDIGTTTPAQGFFTNISGGSNAVFITDGAPTSSLGSEGDIAIDKNNGNLYEKDDLVISGTTWNPSDKHANVLLSNGNLTAEAQNASSVWGVRAISSKSDGKFYWEITVDNTTSNIAVGVATSLAALNLVGGDVYGYGYRYNGQKSHGGSFIPYGSTYTIGDIIGIALDLDNGKLWFSKNGVWQASGDPGAGINEAFSGISGTFYPMGTVGYPGPPSDKITANFGDSVFSYSVPSGFTSGIGTTTSIDWALKHNPLIIENDSWFAGDNYAGTDVVNILKVDEDNKIPVGGELIVGPTTGPESGGIITRTDMPVGIVTAGLEQSFTDKMGGDNVFTYGAFADGVGGVTGHFIRLLGATMHHRTDAGAADYNPSILTSDYLIVVDNSAAARAVTISTEDVQSGSVDTPRFFIIKDELQAAAANNITISLESGNIDGVANKVINTNGNSITLYVDGTNGFVT